MTQNVWGPATPVLRVRNVDASAAYYVNVLGFTLDWSVNGFASVTRDRSTIFLCQGDQTAAAAWVWIGVGDVEALHEELRAKGATVRHPPTNYSWALEMQIEDPDGNVLRIGSDPKEGEPEGEWLDASGRRWAKDASGERVLVSDPIMDPRAQSIIDILGLGPHPEGGFYRESFRSDLDRERRGRSASTAIYFLLRAGEFSAFHVIRGADEIWHHYGGGVVEIHLIAPDGEHRIETLGSDVRSGQRPQVVVPAQTLQAAVNAGSGFALCGCTVSPGFEFADFEMPTREELLRRFPRHEEMIGRLTRPG